MSGIKSAGLITVAGQSSRMGAFKPLLDLYGKPLICRTVESLLFGGVEQIVIVTGSNHLAVAQALANYEKVRIVTNYHYADTAMFDSVKLGLRQLRGSEAVLFMPGDVPCIRPETVQLLLQQWQRRQPDVLYPVYEHENWHPPVLNGLFIEQLLQYDGERGLKGALAKLCTTVEQIAVPDAGCTMDADYRADYKAICHYWPRRYYPNLEHCQAFYMIAETPVSVQQHCFAVALTAMKIGKELQQHQIYLQLDLLESAAFLHDVCRTEPQHAQIGAAFLRYYGLEAVADLVAVHMDWPSEQPIQINEMAVLYLADKLVSGNQQVSLAQRFAQKQKQYQNQPEILKQIQSRAQIALQIIQLLQTFGLEIEENSL